MIQFNSVRSFVSFILFFPILISCKKSDSIDSETTQVWTKITVETRLRTNEIVDMIFDQSGNMWAAFAHGVGKFDGTSWIIYKPFPVDPSGANLDNYAHAIIQDRSGNIWVTIENNGSTYACKFDGNNWTKKFLTGVRIPAVVELPNGKIWFGSTGTGAYIFDGTNWTQSDCNGLCFLNNSAFKDKDGIIWIGGNRSSILKYDGITFSKMTIPYSYGFGGDVVRISQGSSGNIFACLSPGGAWTLKNNNWETVLEPNYPTGPVLSILQDTKGRIWVGTMEKGIFLYDGLNVTEYKLNGEYLYINKILEDKKGIIWLGNSYGLFKFE